MTVVPPAIGTGITRLEHVMGMPIVVARDTDEPAELEPLYDWFRLVDRTFAFAMGRDGPAWTARLSGYEGLTLLDGGRSLRTPGLPLVVGSPGA